MIYIFDLDHTVVDSSHRQATRPDGSLDLDHWREHSTPRLIERDTLLPLAHEWRKLHKRGHTIVVCTARVMGPADYFYLGSRGLFAHKIISRAEGDRTPDDLLKLRGLKQYCRERASHGLAFARLQKCLMTTKSVISCLTANGLPCYDAISTNEALGGAA